MAVRSVSRRLGRRGGPCFGLTYNDAGNWYVDIGVGTVGWSGSAVDTNNMGNYSNGTTLQGNINIPGLGWLGAAGGWNEGSWGLGGGVSGTPGVSATYGIPLSDFMTYLTDVLYPPAIYLNWLQQQNISIGDDFDLFGGGAGGGAGDFGDGGGDPGGDSGGGCQ
jgi:hypothetical protein